MYHHAPIRTGLSVMTKVISLGLSSAQYLPTGSGGKSQAREKAGSPADTSFSFWGGGRGGNRRGKIPPRRPLCLSPVTSSSFRVTHGEVNTDGKKVCSVICAAACALPVPVEWLLLIKAPWATWDPFQPLHTSQEKKELLLSLMFILGRSSHCLTVH